MKKQADTIIYSPSDLVRFMESPFASWMERKKLEDKSVEPLKDPPDPLLEVLQTKGFEHESEFSSQLKQDGHNILEIKRATPEAEAQATFQAMQNGQEIIVQGRLANPPFAGYADYLSKTAGQSKLGDYHYEVWDTKLSKHLKPYFIIQLCCYAELLEAVQGVLPEYVTVVLGDQSHKKLRLSNYFAYYQKLKEGFLTQQEGFNPNKMPNPADSLSHGEWSNYATQLLKEKDHLNQVYNIRRSTIKNLNQAEICTMRELAETNKRRIKKVSQPTFERLKLQAQMQIASKEGEPPAFQLLPHNEEHSKGLHLLPPASPNDIFFDIEGDPLANGGLEYLWGAAYFDKRGKRAFKDFWAHDPAQEKQALEDFIGWIYPCWQADTSMHIYHYGNYEVSALRRLMGCYGTCEHEVDTLLRNEVFVDLYAIIRNSIIIGTSGSSLKDIEQLYRLGRTTEIIGGGDSIVAYQKWLENPDGDGWQSSERLKNIRDYNIDDCNSTQELAKWLREQQTQNKIAYITHDKKGEEIKEDINEITQFRDQLLTKAGKTENTTSAEMIETLAWSLEFHRREEKPVWWKFFDRRDADEIDLEDDMDCLIGLERTETPAFKPARAQTSVQEYCFDINQPFKGKTSRFYVLGQEDELKITTHEYDSDNGIISFKHKKILPARMSVIPNEYVSPAPIPEAIKDVAQSCLKNDFKPSAITDFLHRHRPRIRNHTKQTIIQDKNNMLDEIIKAAVNLDDSYLCIQGPPGSGKTYTAIRIIGALLKQGKRIGIASNSHKAINNLLDGIAQYAQEENIGGFFVKIGGADSEKNVTHHKSARDFNQFCNGLCLGGTAWAFSNPKFAGKFDYLFVDEAGQVSIANLIGMSMSTRNIILMGDQMQLAQPIQGTHPGQSGKSILEYLLQDHATIPPDLGVFLPYTYRMHPDICSFISEMIYEGKLQSKVSPDRRIDIAIPSIKKQAGICFIPVEHEGNTQASEEEASEIRQIANDLLGCEFFPASEDDNPRPLEWKDILFIAPYNYQVNQLKKTLGEKAHVGTVDLFQGQEAPVVILSMCTSDAAESPRGVDFIFSKSRLNVAISRAKCLAIIAGNPNLVSTHANTLKQISQINMFAEVIKR